MATLSVWLLYPIDFYLINLKLGPRKRLVYVMELGYVMATLCDRLLYLPSFPPSYPSAICNQTFVTSKLSKWTIFLKNLGKLEEFVDEELLPIVEYLAELSILVLEK